MTTSTTKGDTTSCASNGLNAAGNSAPWSGRSLDVGKQILEDLRIAKKNKRAADVAEKQAVSAFKYAIAEGLMHEHFDELAEEYCAPGLTVRITSGQRYSEKSYSEELQAAMKAERENGTAKASTYETVRVKLDD